MGDRAFQVAGVTVIVTLPVTPPGSRHLRIKASVVAAAPSQPPQPPARLELEIGDRAAVKVKAQAPRGGAA
jgi:hypothetical protein